MDVTGYAVQFRQPGIYSPLIANIQDSLAFRLAKSFEELFCLF